jgi:hypothetical protein
MGSIVIAGVAPYDGRYDLDLEQRELTTREWGWIKRLSGYLPLTVEDGFGDPELITALAAIALRRAGKIQADEVPAVFDRLADAPFGAAITLDLGQQEDADPADPPLPPSSPVSNGFSGVGSTPSSDRSTGIPRGSGTRGSGSSPLPPVRSGI